jgi:tetratricopeptide (TPR) repeat protein
MMKIKDSIGTFAEMRIERAELLRERGDVNSAFRLLSKVIDDSILDGDVATTATALGQRIACYKIMFQEVKDIIYFEAMEKDLEFGLALPVSESDKAIFFLGKGEVCLFMNDSEEAERFFEKACEVVPKGGFIEAEFNGYLASAKSINGKSKEALRLLDKSLALTQQKVPQRFKKISVIAELHLYRICVALSCGKYRAAISSFLKGYLRARWLKLRFGMPQRLKEYHDAFKLMKNQSE